MNSDEIRKRFIEFFRERRHAVLPSAPLITSDEEFITGKTLFVSAGMQPLIKYLLGHPHPEGKRLVNVQKCVRTQDIDEVGDNTHDTFFEMLGNWSLGDYFKEEAIRWSFELLTNKENGFGLAKERLYITVFEGNENAPRDTEAFEIWKKYMPKNRIYFMSAKSNWWSAGDNGPCGPDTEMFYDITGTLGDMSKEEYMKADDGQKVVEIWNDVFMEYEQKDGKVIGKLKNKNVDTGAGLERLAMVLQNKDNIFDTDLFVPIMKYLNQISRSLDIKAKRIIADHIRTATFMIADGVLPSNTDRGYVLRRLIRRARYYLNSIGAEDKALGAINSTISEIYKSTDYLESRNINEIDLVITNEETHFSATLLFGKKMLEKIIKENGRISGEAMFLLYSTYGYPFELVKEIAKENNIEVDESDFLMRKQQHKELSRSGAEQKFKGGLANHNPQTIKLHTVHHLLLSALQSILGKTVKQKGSNITDERLRIDFLFERKMTDEEKQKVEELVNEYIKKGLNVVRKEIPKPEAEKLGAEMEFGAKYGDIVSLYFIQDGNGTVVSKEFCGGPHVSNTSELGTFKIVKEEAVSLGVRRIKAVLVEN